jgi:hypothetical protein
MEQHVGFTEPEALSLLGKGMISQDTFDQAKLANAFKPEAMPDFTPAQPQLAGVQGGPAIPTDGSANIPPPASVPQAPVRMPAAEGVDLNKIAAYQPKQEQQIAAPNLAEAYKPMAEAQKAVGVAEVKKAQAADLAANQLANAFQRQAADEASRAGRAQKAMDEAKEEADSAKKQYEADQKDFKSAAVINPNRFWEDKSTGQRVGLAISVMLGALGQGLMRSQSNPVIGMIDKAIDKDIDAQKAAYENKKQQASDSFNMYKFYMNKYQDADKATAATKIQMLELQKNELITRASAVNTPIAKANADKAVASFDAQIKMAQDQMSANIVKNKLSQEAEVGKEGIKPEELTKLDKEQKSLAIRMPNGKYKLALTPDDAKQIKESQQAIDNIRTSVNKMEELQNKYGRELFGFTEGAKKAEKMKLDIALNYRKLYDISGLRPGILDEIKNLIPDPTGLLQGRAKEKIGAFKEKLNSLENDMLNVRMPNYTGIQQRSLE